MTWQPESKISPLPPSRDCLSRPTLSDHEGIGEDTYHCTCMTSTVEPVVSSKITHASLLPDSRGLTDQKHTTGRSTTPDASTLVIT